jgi:hypothetical protein
MVVTETKPLEKCCSKCKNIKTEDKFIQKRNIFHLIYKKYPQRPRVSGETHRDPRSLINVI